MELYDVCKRVTALLQERHKDDPMGLIRAKGDFARSTGFLVSLVGPNDPDDPEKVRLVRAAAAERGFLV